MLFFNISFLYAQNVDSLSDNRWKEFERRDKNNHQIGFQDTLYLMNDESGNFSIRKGGFLYKGIMGKANRIDFGIANFSITQEKNKISLQDQSQTHFFKRELKDFSVPSVNANSKTFENKIMDPSNLVGKWFVYKRVNTQKAPSKVNYETLIKSVEFKINVDGTLGDVYTFGKSAEPKYLIESMSSQQITVVDQKKRKSFLKIIDLKPTELIFIDEDGIEYFLKQK